MTLSTFDPRTALIVVDLQQGIVGMPTAHPIDAVVENAATLAATFRQLELPVVLVNVVGTANTRTELSRFSGLPELPAGWADLVPELDQHPEDYLVSKERWGAFTGTELEQLLHDLGVTQVVLAGVATSAGVESTARHAQEYGFHVTFAVDAMTDMDLEAHQNSVTKIFPKVGETGSTEEIIALLASTHPAAPQA